MKRGAALFCLSLPLFGQPCTEPRFGAPVRLFGNGVSDVVLADVTGDGRPDVALLDSVSNALVLLPATTDGFGPPRSLGPGGLFVRTGDVDGDGRLELLVVRALEVQTIFVGTEGSSQAGPVTPLLPEYFRRGAAAADFDGDGHADLVILDAQTPLFFPGDGEGRFLTPRALPLPPHVVPFDVFAGDFGKDANQDLWLPSDYRRDEGALLIGSGDGTFIGATDSPGSDGRAAAVADLDRDGKADRLLAGSLPVVGGGLVVKFASSSSWWTHSVPYPTGLAVGDLDGDGIPDIAVAGGDVLTLFLGDGAHGFPRMLEQNVMLGGRIWILDADGDGRPDLLALRPGGLDLIPNDCASIRPDLVLPSIVSLDGANGARFESELTLVNRSPQALIVEATYTPMSGAGPSARNAPLAPGQRTFASAHDFLRSLGIPIPSGEPAVGSLALRVLQGTPTALAASVRTTSSVAGAPGKGGVAIPGVPVRSLDAAAWIPWLREDAQDRSNLAVVHAGTAADGPISVRVTLFSDDPASAATATVERSLQPGQLQQIDRVLQELGPQAKRGHARVERISGTAPFLAYAVVNDNGTGDGSYVPGIADRERTLARGAIVVPVVVENARYESELVVTNLADRPRVLSASWRAAGGTVRFTLPLGSREQLDLPGFVQRLRDAGVEGIPPRGTDLSGALFLTPDDADVSTLLAGARTYSATGLRYGVYTPAMPTSDAAVYSATVFGLRQDASVRTNLSLVNLGDHTETFSLRFSGSLFPIVNDIPVEPGELVQIGQVLKRYVPGVSESWVEVGAFIQGFAAPFLAFAVVNDGAEPGQGSGDGSYVPMRTW